MAVIRGISPADTEHIEDDGKYKKLVLKKGLARFYIVTDPVCIGRNHDDLYYIISVDHSLDVLTLNLEAKRNKEPYEYEPIASPDESANG